MTTYIPEPQLVQDEDILHPWIDPHHLKKIKGEWWKGRQKVITGDINIRRNIIKDHHDLPAYGHLGRS
jgi:hypothetical protein